MLLKCHLSLRNLPLPYILVIRLLEIRAFSTNHTEDIQVCNTKDLAAAHSGNGTVWVPDRHVTSE